MKFSYPYVLLIIVFLSGCAPIIKQVNTTYKSEGENYSSLSSIQNAYIKNSFNMSDKTESQITLANPSELRIGSIDTVIKGSLLKHGISSLSASEFSELNEKDLSRTIIVEWGISGRNSRGIGAGFSQEVVVMIRNAESKELVYRGIGEYMGQTEVDDLRGALLAALKNLGIKE